MYGKCCQYFPSCIDFGFCFLLIRWRELECQTNGAELCARNLMLEWMVASAANFLFSETYPVQRIVFSLNAWVYMLYGVHFFAFVLMFIAYLCNWRSSNIYRSFCCISRASRVAKLHIFTTFVQHFLSISCMGLYWDFPCVCWKFLRLWTEWQAQKPNWMAQFIKTSWEWQL